MLSPDAFAKVKVWALGLSFFCLLAEVISPTAYGRFGNDASFAVSPRLGWFLMELPCTVVFGYLFWYRAYLLGLRKLSRSSLVLGCIFSLHYAYRGWYYPYNIRVYGNSSNFSLAPAIGGWLVTITHAMLNAEIISKYGKRLTKDSYLKSAQFILGLVLYYSGLVAIMYQDHLMRELRSTPGPRYRIPRGGLWDYITSAQYFSELWGWFGFMVLMDFEPSGMFVFFVSLFNLAPRAVTNHAWYEEHFGADYVQLNRAKLVPFVW